MSHLFAVFTSVFTWVSTDRIGVPAVVGASDAVVFNLLDTFPHVSEILLDALDGVTSHTRELRNMFCTYTGR